MPKGVYQRLILTTPFERLFAKVAKTSTCWIWHGPRNNKGYGMVDFAQPKRKVLAHRLSYELHSGKMIPDGLMVLHRCDVPACVRPSHLFLGTNSVNMQDSIRKGRFHMGRWWSERPGCKNGHRFTTSNTLMRGTTRICRACRRARHQAFLKRHPGYMERYR